MGWPELQGLPQCCSNKTAQDTSMSNNKRIKLRLKVYQDRQTGRHQQLLQVRPLQARMVLVLFSLRSLCRTWCLRHVS